MLRLLGHLATILSAIVLFGASILGIAVLCYGLLHALLTTLHR